MSKEKEKKKKNTKLNLTHKFKNPNGRAYTQEGFRKF